MYINSLTTIHMTYTITGCSNLHIKHLVILSFFFFWYLLSDYTRSIRSTIEAFVKNVSDLAKSLAEILAQPLGVESSYFKENCPPRTSFLRLNRYSPCPFSSQVLGLCSHTDTAFLTIVHQDEVHGLELFNGGRWIGVKPNPEALVVNIGDLFEV